MSMKYDIELTTVERRGLLMDVERSLDASIGQTERARGLRQSERVMTLAMYKRRRIAVQMAIDDLGEPLPAS